MYCLQKLQTINNLMSKIQKVGNFVNNQIIEKQGIVSSIR